MIEALDSYLPYLVAGTSLLLSIVTSAHAVMYKRGARAAALWVGLIWLSPFVGAALYVLLGINRARQQAMARAEPPEAIGLADDNHDGDALERAIDRVARFPRLGGHQIEVLVDGDEAFPAMLDAIRSATHRVHLATYIFDSDDAGLEFRDALAAAVERGVDVRVMVDAVGARYSFPSIIGRLRRAGIRAVRYGRSTWPWHVRYANLRNHRKILVVDDHIGFVGGMNIRAGNVLSRPRTKHTTRDLHFRVVGPVVAELDSVFRHDWKFATGDEVPGPEPSPGARAGANEPGEAGEVGDSSETTGDARARCLADGPDCAVDAIRWTMLAGLACAQKRVRIVTPYFVPDAGLITALATAAIRGVQVDIVLPEASNLRLVKWASTALLWQILERGCRVYYQPAPFDHTKLMIVDDDWCFLGSANWDARSLRLNFEVNLECVDRELVAELTALVEERLSRSREVTLEEVDSRGVLVRLRDGLARLLSPYL